MNRLALAISSALFLATSPAFAANFLTAGPASAADFVIRGAGIKSCGSWTERRKQPSDGFLESWVLGFITALDALKNNRLSQITDFGRKTDNEGLLAWIDNYCRANPLATIYDAAEQLAIHLNTAASP